MFSQFKYPTQWFPANRLGTVSITGNYFLVDNRGNFLVDNSGNFLVTTSQNVIPTAPATWNTGNTYQEIETETGHFLGTESGFNLTAERISIFAKPPTQWLPPNRQGTVTTVGNYFIVDNSGNFLVSNSGDFLVTTTIVVNPLPATSWNNGSPGTDSIEDESGGNIEDEAGNYVYSEQVPSNQLIPIYSKTETEADILITTESDDILTTGEIGSFSRPSTD